jgi:hypothetical protein
VTFTLAAPPQLTVSLAALGPLPVAGQGSVTWRATATGGLPSREYKFWRLDADGWHMAQDYSASNTYTWSPTLNDGGNHAVQVWARNAGSSAAYDAWATTGVFTIAPPPPIHLVFTAVPPLPAIAGATLTWTVQADVSGVEYQVWRYDDGSGWTIVQPYGTDASYIWSTAISDAGSHALQFWVRRVGSSAAYEGWIASGFFLITP